MMKIVIINQTRISLNFWKGYGMKIFMFSDLKNDFQIDMKS